MGRLFWKEFAQANMSVEPKIASSLIESRHRALKLNARSPLPWVGR